MINNYKIREYGSQEELPCSSQWLNVKVFKDNGQQNLQTAFLMQFQEEDEVSLASAKETLEFHLQQTCPNCSNNTITDSSFDKQ